MWAMAHPSVCLFSMNLSTLILTWFDLKMVRYTEISLFMPQIWRTFNHFIAKIVNFYMVSPAQWETIHHIPSKCQPSGGWFGGRETPELGGEGCSMVSTDSDFAWRFFHIKNANIRNHTSYIGTLFRFETPVVGMHFWRSEVWNVGPHGPKLLPNSSLEMCEVGWINWNFGSVMKYFFTVQSGIPPWKPIDRVPSNHRVFPSKLEVPNKQTFTCFRLNFTPLRLSQSLPRCWVSPAVLCHRQPFCGGARQWPQVDFWRMLTYTH